MKRLLSVLGLVLVSCQPLWAGSTFSTGGVSSYVANCGLGPDLPWMVPNAIQVGDYFFRRGLFPVTQWMDGDVWGADFRDGTDADPSGGSDLPDVYFYNGHGSCQNPPVATDPDFIVTCGNFGKPDFNDIGATARWGSASGGQVDFVLLNASCPMDLVSLENNWFPVFAGLHGATGHSGTSSGDTLDSPWRAPQFAADMTGGSFPFFGLGSLGSFDMSVRDAWMLDGLIDVQPGVCAVVIAAGADEAEAISRREFERITDSLGDPVPNWFAWRWICN